ncbi:LOW QUALITY PROTEIN: DUF563 domain-containing protein, partial [Cephalotus follicularis]
YVSGTVHEFNGGILPLYIASQNLNKKAVFVILEYHDWWIMKYGDILSQLAGHPILDFSGERRIHCFRASLIFETCWHGQCLLASNRSFFEAKEREARETLSLATSLGAPLHIAKVVQQGEIKKHKLVVLFPNGSRALTNEDSLVRMAGEIGFRVEVPRPGRTSELAKIYRALNSSDVMIVAHGAAMTHLFLRPSSVFIQVIP